MVLTKSGSDHTGSWIGSEKKKLKTVLKRKTINKKIQEKNHLALLGMAGLCTFAFMGHTVATWRGRLIVTAWLCSQFAISATCVYLSSGWDGGRCLKIIGSPRPPPLHPVCGPLRPCAYRPWGIGWLQLSEWQWILCSRLKAGLHHPWGTFPKSINWLILNGAKLINNYWMRLSMISWIIKTEVCVICRSPPKLKAEADNTDTKFW